MSSASVSTFFSHEPGAEKPSFELALDANEPRKITVYPLGLAGERMPGYPLGYVIDTVVNGEGGDGNDVTGAMFTPVSESSDLDACRKNCERRYGIERFRFDAPYDRCMERCHE